MATLTVGTGGTFATIQAAVAAAANGDTITIEAGVYLEQVTITGFTGLTIIGAEGAIVRAPAGVLAANGVTSSYGGPVYANIAVNNSTGVNISGLVVDGDFAGDRTVGVAPGFDGATDEISGITYINSSGIIDDVTVENVSNSPAGPLFGLQLGSAIFIDGNGAATTAVSVTNSTITDFQKTAILVNDANVTITGNTITGIGFTGLTAQNAIQLGESQGTVSGNTITEFGYDTPPGGTVFEGAGVIAFDMAGPLVISGNTFTGEGPEGFAAAFIEDINTTSVTITDNIVSDTTFGFFIYDADMVPDNAAALSGNTFTNVANAPVIVENATTTFEVQTYDQLVAALAAAEDGDVINLAAGTYTGPLTIADNITINGANAGVPGNAARGPESILDGAVTSSDGVRIDGVQFLNSSNNDTGFNALSLTGAGNSTVTNSVFFSVGANGNTTAGTDDRAITMDTSATGATTISNNYFTGASNGQFSTASWARGVWSDGASSLLTISNNVFEFTRTAMNLDGFNNAATVVSNNRIVDSGSGISIGTVVTSTITGITGNVFENVGTDFNLRNVTTAQAFDLTATNNTGAGMGAEAVITVLGTTQGDAITGSVGDDVIDARNFPSAPDFTPNILNGGGGNDTLIGGEGGDLLLGGMGDDTAFIVPNGGADSFDGGMGNDTLDLSQQGAVTATANGATTTYSYAGGLVAATSVENVIYNGALTVEGGGTDDIITTGAGNEVINGNDGNDTITAGDGNDQVNGGNGNDTIIGGTGAGDDFYDGGAGTDTLVYSSTTLGVTVDLNEIDRSANAEVADLLTAASLPITTPVGLATGVEIDTDAFRNIENVTGGSGNDTIFGNAGDNVILGGGGDDTIRGGEGNDTLDGGMGNDTLDFSARATAVQVNLTTGQVNAGLGDVDTVANFENVQLGAGNDQFIGDDGENGIFGGAGDDQIDGRGGVDTFAYVGVTAADGIADQVFDVLRVNAGAAGTDTLQRVEQVRFINGEEEFTVLIDAAGNALVSSRDDDGAQNEGDTTLTVTAANGVLSNDVNLDQGVGDQKIVSAVNGSAANVGVAIVGTYGTLTLNADGSYTYVQNQAATDSLSGGETVTDTFAYTADDGDTGTSIPANLVITITGVNDAPVTGGTQTGSVTEDSGAGQVAAGTLTVTDVDDGEAFYQPQTTNNEEGFGTFVLLADGSWTYTLDNASLAVQQLGAGVSVTDTFTAETIDGTDVPVTITINGTNDNPVIDAVVFDPIGSGPTFPFSGDELTIGATVINGGADSPSPVPVASLGLAVDLGGFFTTLANSDILNATTVPHVSILLTTSGQQEIFSFTVTAPGIVTIDTDGADLEPGAGAGAGVDSRVWLLDANGVILAQDDDSTITEGAGGSIGGFDSFLSFNVTTPGVYYAVIGGFDRSSGGTIVTSLAPGFSFEAQISVANVDNTPSSTPGDVLTETNAALSTTGEVQFSDVDLNDAPVAAYDSATGFASAVANGPALTTEQATALAAAFTIAPDGEFSFTTPSPDFLGDDDVLTLTYTVTVTDQHGGSASTPVVITINGTNDAPVITSVAQGATLAETNAALTASGAVTATDADNDDSVTFAETASTIAFTGVSAIAPADQTALLDGFVVAADGTWTYNLASPDYLPAGSTVTLVYTVTATDENGATATQDVTIVINGANDAPTIQVNTGVPYEATLPETDAALSTAGQVLFVDIDTDDEPTATYNDESDATVTATGITLTETQIAEIVAGFVLVDAAGNYTFNLASPDYLAAGDTVTATFNVHVVDGNGGDTVQPIVITITGTNDAPVLEDAALFSIADTDQPDTFAPITGTIDSGDIDTDDTATFTLNGDATSQFGTLTLNPDGSYSFAVDNAAVNGLVTGDTRTVVYSVTVTDGAGASDTAAFTITITGANEDPVFEISPLQFFTDDNFGIDIFDLLDGASDPDNVEIDDLDVADFGFQGFTTSGDLTQGQLSLLSTAVNIAVNGATFDAEAGTLSFDTTAFDLLDPGQSVTLEYRYDVTDTNGGSSEQTAFITIFGTLEFNAEQTTPFDDDVVTTQFGDLVFAQDGDDVVFALAGNDEVYGDGGDDFIDAGSGNDLVFGGSGDDEIVGGSGNDVLFGDEPFSFFGGEGGEAEIGDNVISGGSGNDEIYGGLGNNQISAGSGNDDIYIGSAGFFFGGEGGFDDADGEGKPVAGPGGEGGIVIDLPTGLNIVDGGSGFDTVHITGNWSDYTITRTAANTFAFERGTEDGSIESNVYTNVEFFVFASGEGSASELLNDAPEVANVTFDTVELVDGDELPEGGQFVGNVQASDPDEGLGDTLTYFIDGSGAENFTIDEDGNLLLINGLDFETDPRVYTLSLTVVDSRGASDSSTITVNITDGDDPIRPLANPGALTVAEVAAAGTAVFTAAAVDPDAGSTVSYALSDDADGRFTIDASTGVVSVANGNLLDFEQDTAHDITVVATSGDSSTEATFSIAVTDVSPETIVGTAAAETFLAGAGNDSFATNITTSAGDSVNLGMGLDRITVSATAPTNVRLTFTSAEVGNGNVNDSNTMANQDGGLAARLQAEDGADGLTGPITRTDDEGVVYIGDVGVTFDVRDLVSGVSRGDFFEVAILGTSGDDTLNAVQNTRPYYFNAGAGNDIVNGGVANDFLVGGSGNDVLTGNAGNNSYIGGGGIDTVSFANATGGVTAFLFQGTAAANGFGGTDTYTTIENLTGGAGDDLLLGDDNANVLTGGAGNDYLAGLGGDDTLDGGMGDPNSLQGGTGNDTYIVNVAGSTLIEFANEGTDTVRTSLTNFTLGADFENLVFTSASASTGVGNAADNRLTGGTGNDTLTGGAGADTFVAIASNGLDVVTDFVSGTDKLELDGSYTLTGTVDFVSGAGAQAATSTNSTFLYDTTTGILSFDADGTGAGAAVQLFNLGAGTTLVQSDLVFPILP